MILYLAELISIADAISATISTPVETAFEAPSNAAKTREEILAAHRREHRMGVPGKIASDPELEAFILARIETETYAQITAAVKAHFPPERHVGRSTIHRWWRSQAPFRSALDRLTPSVIRRSRI